MEQAEIANLYALIKDVTYTTGRRVIALRTYQLTV
jgi:hypothetical protein